MRPAQYSITPIPVAVGPNPRVVLVLKLILRALPFRLLRVVLAAGTERGPDGCEDGDGAQDEQQLWDRA